MRLEIVMKGLRNPSRCLFHSAIEPTNRSGKLHNRSPRGRVGWGAAVRPLHPFTLFFCALGLAAAAPAQTVVNAIAFDRTTQVLGQDLNDTDTRINALIPLASTISPEEAQEPQWSLAASAGVDPLGRIVYQRGTPSARQIGRASCRERV